NLGTVRNRGMEYLINAKVVDIDPVAFDMTFSSSTNDNVLLSLGKLPTGAPVPPIIVNTQQQHREGYPLGSYFQRTIKYSDANGQGIIARSELTLETVTYFANSLPNIKYTLSQQLSLIKF